MNKFFRGKGKTRLLFGRSMIEMLGVLAVIGVLSIGGLYAYRQAMDRYKANQEIEFLNLMQYVTQEVQDRLVDYQEEGGYAQNARLLCGVAPRLCERIGGFKVRLEGNRIYFYTSRMDIKSCEAVVAQKWHRLEGIQVDYLAGNHYPPELATEGKLNEEQILRLQDYCRHPIKSTKPSFTMRWYIE